MKITKISSPFEDNYVWTSSTNFSQLWGQYKWSAVNVLTTSIKILDLIQRDVFELKLSWINGKLGSKSCHADLSSGWDPWTRWLHEGVLKLEFFRIQVSTFFRVNNFENI